MYLVFTIFLLLLSSQALATTGLQSLGALETLSVVLLSAAGLIPLILIIVVYFSKTMFENFKPLHLLWLMPSIVYLCAGGFLLFGFDHDLQAPLLVSLFVNLIAVIVFLLKVKRTAKHKAERSAQL